MEQDEFLYQRWKHERSGYTYIIVGVCRLEATNRPAYLYTQIEQPDGIVWARDMDEFLDGRFMPLDK